MKKYAIVVERAARNYGAYVPDLPGWVATGATVEEVEWLLREAIALHVAGLREDGLPVPEPSSQVDYLEVPASQAVPRSAALALSGTRTGLRAEPAVVEDGAGGAALGGIVPFRPAPLLNLVLGRKVNQAGTLRVC
jgi:predicted RNase H-like HicB family nuclease